MTGLLLHDLVATSTALAGTRSRLAKRDLIADLLRRTPAEDVAVAATYLSGALRQRRPGLGRRNIPRLPAAPEPTLTVAGVDAALAAMADASGPGAVGLRAAAAERLFGAATRAEQDYLAALLTGTLRQGSLEGPLLAALTAAYDVPEPVLRRGLMFAGEIGVLARAAADGVAAVESLGLEVGRPVRPMLAGAAKSVAETIDGERLVETKLDGIRLQIHVRRGEHGVQVRCFTRSLDDITDRLPEVVALAASWPVTAAVVDAEVLALGPGGRPRPFQVTGARTASSADPGRLAGTTPLSTVVFDLLHLDGRDLLDEPLATRHALLAELAPDELVRGLRTADPEAAEAFAAEVVAAGHEGVVVKDPTGPYAAGRRGGGWVKVKPRRTLDLVVLAVEPGSGRRAGLLSNIHLGARDPRTGDFVMVGKTFKGMTDAVLRWQTERFRELAVGEDGYVLRLRPEQVVEIALDGVQSSRRYPGGVALRFARVVRYRDDKTPAEIDTIDTVRGMLA